MNYKNLYFERTFRKEAITQIPKYTCFKLVCLSVQWTRSMVMRGTCGICCFIRKTTIRAVAPWLTHRGEKRNKRILIFHKSLKTLHFCIKFKLKSLFHIVCLSDFIRKKSKRQKGCRWIKGRLEVKHLHCPQRGTDGCIKPVHLSSNSLLHWRKTGHFYCQRTREIWRWMQKRGGRREPREAVEKAGRREEEGLGSPSGTEKQSDRFHHGNVTLTVSCSSRRLSRVGWLLMEPSYQGRTSVMKVYSSYWIRWWDLCLFRAYGCNRPLFYSHNQSVEGEHRTCIVDTYTHYIPELWMLVGLMCKQYIFHLWFHLWKMFWVKFCQART